MYQTKAPDREYEIEERSRVSWSSLTQPTDLDARMSDRQCGEIRIFDSEFLLEALVGKIHRKIEGFASDVNAKCVCTLSLVHFL